MVHVVLNRPGARNALNTAMVNSLVTVFDEIESRECDRVLVLSGSGGCFCAGADLREAMTEEGRVGRVHVMNTVASALHRLSKPTIAKVDGAAVGGGCSLALGCDLVLASERAVFSLIFAQRALSADMGISWLLPRMVGRHRALELAFFGDSISSADAAEFGLVNRVVPAEDLDKAVETWARRLSVAAQGAVRDNKRLLSDGLASSWEEALAAESVCQSRNIVSADAAEARLAFREKRVPRFR